MLRSAEVAQGALVSLFQVGLGAFWQYDREGSEERRSEEHFHGTVQATKLSNSGSRSLGMASSACRGVPRNSGVACAPWVPSFLTATYFQPCERHRHHKKNECTFFCITCGLKPQSICQHCMGAHAGHQVIQVRRYVYCDVVRACDINSFVDTSGVQNYIINSAKVMFLNHRPHSKIGRANGVDICRSCHRHLREGFSYCSLACKVEALTKGETSPVGAPNGAARAAEAGISATITTTTAGPFASSSPRSRPINPERPSLGGGSTAGNFSSRPRTALGSLPPRAGAGAAGGGFGAATTSVFAPLSSSDVVAADASCAALSSDPESSELGEDTYVFGGEDGGGGGGTSPLGKRRAEIAAAMVAAVVARRRLAAGGGEGEADRSWSSNGSASSKDGDDYCYEYNFENPPKRRRTSHIIRRPSSSNGFVAPPAPAAPQQPRGCSTGTDSDGTTTDIEAAAAAVTAAATLLMPFRTTSSGGLIPAAPAPPSPPSGGFTASGFLGSLDSSVPISAAADLARAASAPVAMSSRRKQHAPQRAPSC